MASTTGLCLGYNSTHPFSKVHIKDRASVQELLCTLLDPLEPFFSAGKARVRCPGATAVRFDQSASEVEGICRPLWGLSALLAGGGQYRGTEWWVQGIKAGTDPENPEYWGYPRDNDQRMVEMCPLGMLASILVGLDPNAIQDLPWLLYPNSGRASQTRSEVTLRIGLETQSMRKSW